MLNHFAIFKTTGFLYVTPGMVIMWVIGLTLIYLAIAKDYEPLLLLPIGFGILLANMPLLVLCIREKDGCGVFTTMGFNGKLFLH